MELTVFLLLGVIVAVALLTRRRAARARKAPANPTPRAPTAPDGEPTPKEHTE